MDSLDHRDRAIALQAAPGALRIYNLFPLLFRDFDDMARLLPHVAAMGFDWVFLNPVHEPGLSGSLYCIRDHFSVSARLAGSAEPDLHETLSLFCSRCEKYGLRVMVDLVINHVAIDGVVAERHPDWIQRSPDGSLVHPGAIDPADASRHTVWGDLAAIDYSRPALHQELLDYWLQLVRLLVGAGVRGFRCDAAYQVPNEIWRRLIDEARRMRPDLVFAAETLGCRVEEVERLAPAGFDLLFNSSKWWDLEAPWAIRQYNEFRRIAPSIAFPESHDTPRLAAEHPELATDEALARLYLLRYALAASFSTGVMMLVGYEYGFGRALDVVATGPGGWEEKRFDLSAEIARINAIKARSPALAEEGPLRRIEIADGLVVLHRSSADGRHHALFVANPGAPAQTLLADRHALAGAIGVAPDSLIDRYGFDDSARFALEPHGWRLLTAESGPAERDKPAPRRPAMPVEWAAEARIAIEAIYPEIDGGRFPIKRILGDTVPVWVDIFCDGHEVIACHILYRAQDEDSWRTARLRHYDNDRWTGGFVIDRIGRWNYTVEAWTDAFASIRRDLVKKRDAGQPVTVEIQEAITLVGTAIEHAAEPDRAMLSELVRVMEQQQDSDRIAVILSTELLAAMRRWGPRHDLTRYHRTLELIADRPAARFSSWYEIMPRSQGTEAGRSATLSDCIRRLPEIASMGFDVLYLLPIHPIGRVNRKGPNNSLKAGPDDPGSPYAIGATEGGHTAIHPALGTIEDFRALVRACREHGIEIALDFAIQCAPDHPWVSAHPDWFRWRPDGTIRFAENPPKKYEDIVNVEFYGPQREAVWRALADVVLYWANEGVRIFRVDNPHTKPLPFWEWMIREVQAIYPDAIFLAEAFTRPKMMQRLAKVGFTMSYTYFTWRNTKAELVEYLTELAQTQGREFFRPNFFANTPDILPPILQAGGPAAFRIRFALAALLSGVYGIYNGFELCEGTAVPGTEEYLHSEKYQYKVWDWDRPGNIKPYITALNRIRAENAALQDWANIVFHEVDSDQAIFFSKLARDRSHVILAAISLDPRTAVSATLSPPLEFLRHDRRGVAVEDLLEGETIEMGPQLRVTLTPDQPLLLLRHRYL